MKNPKNLLITAVLLMAVGIGLLRSGRRGAEGGLEPGGLAADRAPSRTIRPAEAARSHERESRAESMKAEVKLVQPEKIEARIAALLAGGRNTSHREVREQLQADLRHLEAMHRAETEAKAERLGVPLVTEAGAVLAAFDGERPRYDISHNADAAISIATHRVRQTLPYAVDGKDKIIGLWDVGYAPSEDHQDLSGRISIKDTAFPFGFHATHVAGTMIGNGAEPLAKGMAPLGKLWAYSSTDMLSELAGVAGTDDSDFGGLYVSVHPYGSAAGWEYDGKQWYGVFSNDGKRHNDYAPVFGQYGSATASWDGLVKSFPYHLMVKSAGNHANDKRPESGAHWSLNGTSTKYRFDPQEHPKSDKRQYSTAQPLGFGTIDSRASAKNILTVGSVSDAVTGGDRDLAAASLSVFSSTGPTDDGRLKPDLVTNGESVYSADAYSTDRYFELSGTSMAAASAGGAALLLVDLQKDLSGRAVQASTLKGLLIHTADDLGNPGPDYRYGWGLMNVEGAAQLLVDHEAVRDQGWARFVEESLRSASDGDYYVIEHDGISPLRVTLCWTDQPGAWTSGHDNRTRRLVNDLNLRVVAPDGTTHHPFVMSYSSTFADEDLDAAAVTGVNSVDNVEQVLLLDAPAGTYTIEVGLEGALTGAQQDYSLLLSGARLLGPGVQVENPVADQSYLVLNTNKIDDVCDPALVFSGQDHVYDFSITPAGLCTGEFGAGGRLDLFPAATAYGTVEITVTARDASGGVASDTFRVTLRSNTMYVSMASPAASAEQDGATWATAYRHLQDALASAVEGQEIWVAEGIYYPDEDRAGDTDERGRSFVMVRKVSMFGGFGGGETSRALRDPSQYLCILSGDIRQDDAQQPVATRTVPNPGDHNNSYRVVDLSACYGVESFDGFVVTAGRADFGPEHSNGAGIHVVEDVRIANCWITGNYAADGGGGVYLAGNNPIITKCRLTGNEAGGAGGAVYAFQGAPDFFHCEVRGNQAADGGAFYLDLTAPTLDLVNCLVSGNIGSAGGAGIHMAKGKLLVVNSTLSGNYSLESGGAIHIVDASEKPVFKNSILWDNHGGGTASSPLASACFADAGDAPKFYHCLVANSGGSAAWDASVGIDEGSNLDLDPGFLGGLAPGSLPSTSGDFTLGAGSPAIDAGLEAYLIADKADLDGDGDTGERVPLDLAGRARVTSAEIDLGVHEFDDLSLLDGDHDGLSDEFEQDYGDENGELDPQSDLDGDGLTALGEFIHGLNPNAPLREPVISTGEMTHLGTSYFCVTFQVNPVAMNFAAVTVERRSDLGASTGWRENEVIQVSSVPSSSHPGMLDVTYRSLIPFGQERMEFVRLRHDPLPE